MSEATETVSEAVKRWVTSKGFVWSVLVIALLAMVSWPAVIVCGPSEEISKQMSDVRQLVLAAREFASENDGNLPASLDQLYPAFLDERSGFETDFTLSGKVERYWYCPVPAGLDGTARPLVLAPPPPQGRGRVVGLLGGATKTLSEEDFTSLAIDLSDWIR